MNVYATGWAVPPVVILLALGVWKAVELIQAVI